MTRTNCCQIFLVNYCFSSPCQNNGTCISNSTGFSCICDTTRFQGKFCQMSNLVLAIQRLIVKR